MIKSIKFNSLTMRNFMSYAEFSLTDLAKYKIIFIAGKNAQGKSTLTSEAPYYALFGDSLRYNKNSQLLSWYYDPDLNEPSFSQLGLSFDFGTHVSNVLIKRNIIGDEKYSIDVDDDPIKYFDELKSIIRVPDLNKEIKTLLDIDEKKFSILYLKSPFSSPIFETDSDLLSSITKSQHINELRKEFNAVVATLKSDVNNMSITIEKQNELAATINKQLQAIANTDKQRDDKEQLEKVIDELEKMEQEIILTNEIITRKRAEYSNIATRKNNGIEWTTKVKTYLNQLRKDKDRLIQLTERGKCPTCEQSISRTLYTEDLTDIDEKIHKHQSLYEEGATKLSEINNTLNTIDNNLTDAQNKQRNYNDKIRSLSNMKSQLKTNINNYNDNKSNNDEILKQIRVKIMDLNDELSLLQTDYKILDSISKLMLGKNSEYINIFFDKKINSFNIVFRSILSKMTKGKYTDVKMKLNNKPTLNGHIEYESLSTSERKFIDLSFVISYIVYLSKKLKLKTFILDEFFDNYDKENIVHIYKMVYETAYTHDLQLVITTNMADYLFNYMGDMDDVKIIELDR